MITLEKETALESYLEDLREYINDECFDMLDEFTDEEIANVVISIARRLIHRPFCNGHMIKGKLDYLYSINNSLDGWVSVSNDSDTGVSYTEYYPYFEDDEDEGALYGLKNLASMLNEAWYLCN